MNLLLEPFPQMFQLLSRVEDVAAQLIVGYPGPLELVLWNAVSQLLLKLVDLGDLGLTLVVCLNELLLQLLHLLVLPYQLLLLSYHSLLKVKSR